MNSAVFMKLFINLIISWFTSFDDIISNHALRLSLAAPHPHPSTVSRPMICIPVSSSTPIGKLHVDWCLSVWHPFHTYPVIWLWQNLYCFYKKKAGVVENWLFSLFLVNYPYTVESLKICRGQFSWIVGFLLFLGM